MNKKLSIYSLLFFIKQFFSTLVPLLTVPYVSRILTIESIGVANYSSSIVSYFTLIAIFGVNVYGVREIGKIKNNKSKVKRVVSELSTINLCMLFFSYICLLFLVYIIPSFYEIRIAILISSIQIFFYAFSWEWFLNAYEEYLFSAVINIISNILIAVSTFTLIKSDSDVYKYIVIMYIGIVFNSLISYAYIKHKYTIKLSIKKIKYIELSSMIYIFLNTLLQTIYVNIDTVMIGIIMDNYNVGLYSSSVKIYTICKTILSIPISISISRCSYLFFNKLIEEYKKLLENLFNILLLILVPSCIGLALLSGNILEMIFSERYASATTSLFFLSFSMLFSVLNIFINSLVLIPQNKEKFLMKISCVSSCVNLILNFILIPMFGINGAAFSTMISELIIVLFSSRILLKNIKFSKLIITIYESVIGSIMIATIVYFCKLLLNGNIEVVFVSITISSFSYFIFLIILRNKYIISVFNNLVKR